MDAVPTRDERRRTDGEGVWSWHPWAGAKLAVITTSDGD